MICDHELSNKRKTKRRENNSRNLADSVGMRPGFISVRGLVTLKYRKFRISF
jgi:hypothetical protein